jgi:hypothetical protein
MSRRGEPEVVDCARSHKRRTTRLSGAEVIANIIEPFLSSAMCESAGLLATTSVVVLAAKSLWVVNRDALVVSI